MITTTILKQRALTGDAEAQFRLGYRYAFSRKISERDSKKAIRWWKPASLQGNTRAQFYLAVCYESGNGCKKIGRRRCLCTRRQLWLAIQRLSTTSPIVIGTEMASEKITESLSSG